MIPMKSLPQTPEKKPLLESGGGSLLVDDARAGMPVSRGDRLALNLYAGDPTALEWFFASLKIIWGLWLMLPIHTFASAPGVYSVVSQSPQWLYGLAFAALGAAEWRAWYEDARLWRWRLALGGVFVWISWGSLLWAGDHRTSALVLYGVMAAFRGLTGVWLYGKSHAPGEKANKGGPHECPPSA